MAEEAISNMRTVKAFACESHEIEKFKEMNNEVYKIGLKASVWNAMFSFIIQFSVYGAMAGVIYFGA